MVVDLTWNIRSIRATGNHSFIGVYLMNSALSKFVNIQERNRRSRLKEFDPLLVFITEDLRLAAFNKDIKRFKHNI